MEIGGTAKNYYFANITGEDEVLFVAELLHDLRNVILLQIIMLLDDCQNSVLEIEAELTDTRVCLPTK